MYEIIQAYLKSRSGMYLLNMKENRDYRKNINIENINIENRINVRKIKKMQQELKKLFKIYRKQFKAFSINSEYNSKRLSGFKKL